MLRFHIINATGVGKKLFFRHVKIQVRKMMHSSLVTQHSLNCLTFTSLHFYVQTEYLSSSNFLVSSVQCKNDFPIYISQIHIIYVPKNRVDTFDFFFLFVEDTNMQLSMLMKIY